MGRVSSVPVELGLWELGVRPARRFLVLDLETTNSLSVTVLFLHNSEYLNTADWIFAGTFPNKWRHMRTFPHNICAVTFEIDTWAFLILEHVKLLSIFPLESPGWEWISLKMAHLIYPHRHCLMSLHPTPGGSCDCRGLPLAKNDATGLHQWLHGFFYPEGDRLVCYSEVDY